MSLSNDVVSQFAKTVNGKKKEKTESTVYGTVVIYEGQRYVKMDGSDLLTPCDTTVSANEGERVTVLVKNHTATINGNLSSPSARTGDVEDVREQVLEVQRVVADKATIKDLEAERARIEELVADNAVIKGRVSASEADIGELQTDNATVKGKLEATEASIKKLDTEKLSATDADIKFATIENLKSTNAKVGTLEADNATVKGKLEATEANIGELTSDNAAIKGRLTAAEGSITKLDTEKLTATDANIKFATIKSLEAVSGKVEVLEADNVTINSTLTANKASIESLETNKLSASDAELKYANIDFANIGKAAMEKFYSESGLIKNVVVGDQTITGELVGVTIRGDLIEGNTIVADKLVIKGEDGLYYKLNTNGNGVSSEQTDYNSLNGTVIRAKSITAEKVSIKDLVAFGADIGGNHIGNDSIYSGAKTSATNTTRGFYLGSDGQVGFGDSSQYIRFYKDSNGQFHLNISVEDLVFTSSTDSVKTIVEKAAEDSKNASKTAQEALSVLGGISTLDALGASLDNDAHVVHTKTDGSGGNYSDCITKMTVYLGDTNVSNDTVFSVSPSEGVSGIWNEKLRTYQVTGMSTDNGYVDIDALYGTGERFLTTRKGLHLTTRTGKYITIRSGGSHIKKRFSISKAPDGKIGLNYNLKSSTLAIRKQKDEKTLIPASVTFSASEINDGKVSAYSGRYVIEESADGIDYTIKYSSSADELKKEYTPSSANIKSVRATLYMAGGVTQQLDTQTIIVLADAEGLSEDISNAMKVAKEAIEGVQTIEKRVGIVEKKDTEFKARFEAVEGDIVGITDGALLYNVRYVDNGNDTTTLYAAVYKKGLDVTTEYPTRWFTWVRKTEAGEVYLGFGYQITVENENFEFGGVCVGRFATYDAYNLVTRSGKNLTTRSGAKFTIWREN